MQDKQEVLQQATPTTDPNGNNPSNWKRIAGVILLASDAALISILAFTAYTRPNIFYNTSNKEFN